VSGIDFSEIAKEYERFASVQISASEKLFKLLDIKDYEDVLDLGCGTGHLTRKLRRVTKGRVVGIDPSEGMIRQAVMKSRGLDISYEIKSAEEMGYERNFDVIICNSVLQWFKYPGKAIKNCYRALRDGGRIGIQAPAKNLYCPNFIEAVKRVKHDKRTKDIFSHFKEPWFLLETEEEYKSLFEKYGFKVLLSEIEETVTEHTPDEVFGIFSSGAIAGYLNPDCYSTEITEEYISAFKEIVKEAFGQQSDKKGMVKLKFNRIYLLALKG